MQRLRREPKEIGAMLQCGAKPATQGSADMGLSFYSPRRLASADANGPAATAAATDGCASSSCGSSAGADDLPPEIWEKVKNHPCYTRKPTTISPACMSPSRRRATFSATTATGNTIALTSPALVWCRAADARAGRAGRFSPSPGACRNYRSLESLDQAMLFTIGAIPRRRSIWLRNASRI